MPFRVVKHDSEQNKIGIDGEYVMNTDRKEQAQKTTKGMDNTNLMNTNSVLLVSCAQRDGWDDGASLAVGSGSDMDSASGKAFDCLGM